MEDTDKMKMKLIRLLIAISVMLFVNVESPSVTAADFSNEANEVVENTPLNQAKETDETTEEVPADKIVVSDKLMIEPKKVHAGEQVSFKLALPEENDYETIILSYLSSETKTEVDVTLTYDSEKKLYEGILKTGNDTNVGIWQFTKAVGIDKNKGVNVLETTPLTSEIEELKQGDFEVIPHPTSVLDLPSIKVEPKPVKIGETLQFSMKSIKNVALTNVTVVYRSSIENNEKTDQRLTLSLTYNEETKEYEEKFAAIAPDLIGDWVIEYISASDANGNPYKLFNQFVIEWDKEKVQKQINELNAQLIKEQSVEELEVTAIQEKNAVLKETIKKLEATIAAKEKLLQENLSIGNFTIEENLVEEEIDPIIDEEIPLKNEESLAETESTNSLTNPNPAVNKEEAVTDLADKQKNEAGSSSTASESKSANEESNQLVNKTSIGDEPVIDEKTDVMKLSKGSLLIVLAAFIIINGFIFKF